MGEELEGVVVNVISFGFFVCFIELYIDGLVYILILVNDYYYYDLIG